MQESGYKYPHFYDEVYKTLRTKDISFYVRRMQKAKRVCEIGCGTGRITIPAAQAGAKIHAIDPSEKMLNHLRVKAKMHMQDGRITTELASFHDFEENGFDLIVSPFRAFQHLNSIEAQIDSLSNVKKNLLPGGKFIFDVFAPSYFKLAHPLHDDIDVVFIHPISQNRVERYANVHPDYAAQILHIHFVYVELDKEGYPISTHDEYHTMRWFHRFEIEHLLLRCGFKIDAIWGDFESGIAYDYHSGEMIIIAH